MNKETQCIYVLSFELHVFDFILKGTGISFTQNQLLIQYTNNQGTTM